jgi:hypothetical protein
LIVIILKALFLPVLISEIEADDFVYIVTQTIANNDYQVQKIEIEAPEENALQSVTLIGTLKFYFV